jgi:hypothetical protein
VLKRAFDWTFRSRETGRIVIGQWPNVPLVVFLVAWAASWLAGPDGTVGRVLLDLSRITLVWWAVDELVRGVNPWRRALGLGVLVSLAAVMMS